MTTDTTPPRVHALPRVWQDEDAYAYWAEGHIAPERFILAVLLDLHENCGLIEVGGYLDADRMESEISAVNHLWFRMVGDEQMERCEATDDGAAPWTRLGL